MTGALFGDTAFSDLTDDDIEALAGEIYTVGTGISVIDALVNAGLASSNGEARRLIESDAVSVNGVKIFTDQPLDSRSLVKKGKNSFVLVK